jgi:hypothetical protein
MNGNPYSAAEFQSLPEPFKRLLNKTGFLGSYINYSGDRIGVLSSPVTLGWSRVGREDRAEVQLCMGLFTLMGTNPDAAHELARHTGCPFGMSAAGWIALHADWYSIAAFRREDKEITQVQATLLSLLIVESIQKALNLPTDVLIAEISPTISWGAEDTLLLDIMFTIPCSEQEWSRSQAIIDVQAESSMAFHQAFGSKHKLAAEEADKLMAKLKVNVRDLGDNLH